MMSNDGLRFKVLDTPVIQWSDYYKVRILKNLFSHHRQSAVTSSTSFDWVGQSGKEYQYEIHPIDASFEALPGNYIYAKQVDDGSWIPVYIAQTRDLRQRLEGHIRVDDAIQNGATHIHAHYCVTGQAARCSEERDLILQWQPACNERPDE
jgi:hypothetical protein